jgi:hypothetical protein
MLGPHESIAHRGKRKIHSRLTARQPGGHPFDRDTLRISSELPGKGWFYGSVSLGRRYVRRTMATKSQGSREQLRRHGRPIAGLGHQRRTRRSDGRGRLRLQNGGRFASPPLQNSGLLHGGSAAVRQSGHVRVAGDDGPQLTRRALPFRQAPGATFGLFVRRAGPWAWLLRPSLSGCSCGGQFCDRVGEGFEQKP